MEKVIFVDFFDTTVFRKKSAKEVLFDFAVALGDMHGVEPAAIYNLFLKHQRNLTIEKWRKTGEAEYKFDEIMERVAADLFRPYGGEGAEAFLTSALPVYFKTELNSMTLNESLFSYLKAQKEGGAKLYIVSQFYCSKQTLADWITALAGEMIFDAVFVSCDYGKSKRTGSIYRYLLRALQLEPKDVLMMGDNRHSDYVQARRAGLRAKWLKHKKITPPRGSRRVKSTARTNCFCGKSSMKMPTIYMQTMHSPSFSLQNGSAQV